ncbi:MAG TPA: MASE1 domain-containing protein [Candidatus Limnocylindrales bacterium]
MRYPLGIAAVAAMYFAAGQVGLELALVRGQVTPLWPPTGIALACLLVWGWRMWPGITLGALAVNAPFGPSPLAVALIAAGNTLAPLCSYALLHFAGFRSDLRRFRDAVLLVVLGALVGMLVSAGSGTGVLIWFDALAPQQFWSTVSVWWTGDAMGVLVIVPLVLAVRLATWPRGVRPIRWIEGVLLLAATVAVAVVGTVSPAQFHLTFAAFPVLIWAATRFQLLGAAACVLVISVTAVLAAAAGIGAFADLELLERMVNLQAFNGAVAMTGLLLACMTTERLEAIWSIEQARAQLTRAVASIHTGTPQTYLSPTRPGDTRRS